MRTRTSGSPNQESGRRGRTPTGIVLHTNVGSFESTCDWFADPESGVSAHYLVGLDGRVAQFVDEEDTARHAGRVADPTTPLHAGDDPNLHTIGIEFEDGGDPLGAERTPRQYRAGARLVREIALRWDIPLDRDHIVGHRELFAAQGLPRQPRPRAGGAARAAAVRGVPAAGPKRRGGPAGVPRLGRGRVRRGRGAGRRQHRPDRRAAARLAARRDPAGETTAGVVRGLGRRGEPSAPARRGGGPRAGLDRLARRRRADRRRGRCRPAHVPGNRRHPACAYGLEHFRIWADDRYDSRSTWVYRVFAWRPGQRSRSSGSTSTRSRRTSRARRGSGPRCGSRHLGAGSEEQLEQRLSKYREADPDRRWPTDFGRLSTTPSGRPPLLAAPAGRPAGARGWPGRTRGPARLPAARPQRRGRPTRLVRVGPPVRGRRGGPRRREHGSHPRATRRRAARTGAAREPPPGLVRGLGRRREPPAPAGRRRRA